jgi:hypothetical protein
MSNGEITVEISVGLFASRDGAAFDEIFVFMSADVLSIAGVESPGPAPWSFLAAPSIETAGDLMGIAKRLSETSKSPVGLFRFKRGEQVWSTDASV